MSQEDHQRRGNSTSGDWKAQSPHGPTVWVQLINGRIRTSRAVYLRSLFTLFLEKALARNHRRIAILPQRGLRAHHLRTFLFSVPTAGRIHTPELPADGPDYGASAKQTDFPPLKELGPILRNIPPGDNRRRGLRCILRQNAMAGVLRPSIRIAHLGRHITHRLSPCEALHRSAVYRWFYFKKCPS